MEAKSIVQENLSLKESEEHAPDEIIYSRLSVSHPSNAGFPSRQSKIRSQMQSSRTRLVSMPHRRVPASARFMTQMHGS